MSLFPGTWHKKIPREVHANLRWRRHVVASACANPELQQAIRYACERDILFFVNTFVYQTNPLLTGKEVGPFVTWPFQERAIAILIKAKEEDKSVVVEKSREMGWTWLPLILEVSMLLFMSFTRWNNMSKSEDAVDDGSGDCLFGKLRFILSYIPDWLKGKIISSRKYLLCERTQSEIRGEAATARATVGGRLTGFLFDEVAEMPEADQVSEKTASTTEFRIFVSTHLGEGNAFYDICQKRSLIKIMTHWTCHPRKNSGLYSWDDKNNKLRFWLYDDEKDRIVEIPGPIHRVLDGYDFDKSGRPAGGPYPGIRSPWYDKKSEDIRFKEGDDRGVSQQLDINPAGAVSQFYLPNVIRDLKTRCLAPFWEGELEYDKTNAEPIKLVSKKDGRLKLWLNLSDGDKPPPSVYGAGADISQGTGATPSCLSIADRETGTKVAELIDANIFPQDFAILCVSLCRLFNDGMGNGAMIAWEHTGPGTTFGLVVYERLQYLNIYCEDRQRALLDKGPRVKRVIGFNPSAKGALHQLHQEYRAALVSGRYKNYSEQSLDETLNFKHDGKGSVVHTAFDSLNPAAGRTNHGDIVIADALSWLVIKRDHDPKEEPSVPDDVYDPRSFKGRRNLDQMWEDQNREVWVE